MSAILDDSGTYTATATNEHGSVSCHCRLTVDKGIRAYIAPEFLGFLEPEYVVKCGKEIRVCAQIEAYPSVGKQHLIMFCCFFFCSNYWYPHKNVYIS